MSLHSALLHVVKDVVQDLLVGEGPPGKGCVEHLLCLQSNAAISCRAEAHEKLQGLDVRRREAHKRFRKLTPLKQQCFSWVPLYTLPHTAATSPFKKAKTYGIHEDDCILHDRLDRGNVASQRISQDTLCQLESLELRFVGRLNNNI